MVTRRADRTTTRPRTSATMERPFVLAERWAANSAWTRPSVCVAEEVDAHADQQLGGDEHARQGRSDFEASTAAWLWAACPEASWRRNISVGVN